LDLTRASGFYAGRGSVTGERGRRNTAGVEPILARMRNDAHLSARAARLVPVTSPVTLWFVHMGESPRGKTRRDPSSWYLSAKAVEDGLTDAGVLPSDRFFVTATAGACKPATDPVWQDTIRHWTGESPGGRAGMFVLIGGGPNVLAF
jgi:hypothetical protein